ncbi:hypothetical protein BV898_16556, partial [Hypsibius exemplaris]
RHPAFRALGRVWYAVFDDRQPGPGSQNTFSLFRGLMLGQDMRRCRLLIAPHCACIYVRLVPARLYRQLHRPIPLRPRSAWQLSPVLLPVSLKCLKWKMNLSGKDKAFEGTTTGAAMIISNWLDVLLAVNRLVAICIPLRYRAFSQRRNTLAILAVLWVFAVTTTGLSGIFEIGGRYITSPAGQCVFVGRDAFASFQYIFSSFVPTAIVGIIAVLIIARTASRSVHSRVEIDVLRLGPRDRSQQYRLGPQAQRRLGLAKMLLVSFLLSFLTGLPMMIIMNSYPQLLQRELMATLWLRIFGVAPFTLNPFVFYAMNKDFRKGLLALFDSRPSTDTASVLLETNGKTFGRSLEMKTISMKSRLVTLDLEGSSETVLTV